MPIISIEIVGDVSVNKVNLTQRIADVFGSIFGTPPGSTWVKLSYTPQENYAENESSGVTCSPVFLTVLLRNPIEEEKKNELALKFSEAIGRCMGRPPEIIHTYFVPEGRGRMAFGGKLISS